MLYLLSKVPRFDAHFPSCFADVKIPPQNQCSSVQSLSHVRLFATPWIAAHQASLSITNSQSLLKLMPIESVMPSIHLILYHPLLLLPPIPPSIRVFSNESSLRMRWPNIGVSASASVLPMNNQDWFPLGWTGWISLQETPQESSPHHSSKAIFWCSVFFTVQLSHPYMTTGKIIALTRWTFVGKVMSLLFNMLCWLVISFSLRSKCLLISWLHRIKDTNYLTTKSTQPQASWSLRIDNVTPPCSLPKSENCIPAHPSPGF